MEKEEDEEEKMRRRKGFQVPGSCICQEFCFIDFSFASVQFSEKIVVEFQENQRLNNYLIIIIITIVIIICLIVIFKIAPIGRLRCCQQRCKKYDFARFCTESGLRAVPCNPLEKI